jgi:hypothetical protein
VAEVDKPGTEAGMRRGLRELPCARKTVESLKAEPAGLR